MTGKQKIFADEYLIGLNATRAYQSAYPTVKNDKTAASAGSRLLKNAEVAEYLRERMLERQRRTEITQDRVLQELAAIGFARASDYARITPGGLVELEATENLTETQKAALVSIKQTREGAVIKLADKVKALELLGKHLGLFSGEGKAEEPARSNLLERLKEITWGDDDFGIPEVQQPPEAGHALVENGETQG